MVELCFKDVSKAYGARQVLRHFSAQIAPGERVAIMGPSGSGKTTLARLAMGLEQPDEGSVTQGIRFACAFQENRLCPGFSAVQNIALVLPRGQGRLARTALAEVGLCAEDMEKPVSQLSGGQRSRVALVRAVQATGEALVLDEAFRGLDEDTFARTLTYVQQNLRGRTLLVITHNGGEADALCQRKILL